MAEYGSLDFLNSNISEKIKKILKHLYDNNIEFDIYYGYPVIDSSDKKEFVKGFLILQNNIIILYENDEEIPLFASSLMSHLSQDPKLAFIMMEYNKYISQLNLLEFDFEQLQLIINKSLLFSDTQLLLINRAIQKAFNLTSEDNREIKKPNSLGQKIKERNTYIGKYDSTQFNMVHSPIINNQRIRGLAGSGKTILMLKKMAFLHFHHPELNLAFVFYTTSLKSSIINLFLNFYKDYDRFNKPDMSKVNIFHAWGGKTRKGFYSELCERNDLYPKTFSEAKNESKEWDSFEYVCKELNGYLEKDSNYKGDFDYIFVDEAQDFGIEFYKLCLKSLSKEINENIKTGFLIYAYDELQSLKSEVQIPSKVQIFGSEDLCEDINLKHSYRAPVEILTTAHAIGLGVYRTTDNEHEHSLVNFVDENNFIDMGYTNLSNKFEPGYEVCLTRNENKTHISIPETISESSEATEYAKASELIINLIRNEDVNPNDIMIIDLDERYLTQDYEHFSRIFFDKLKEDQNDTNISIKLMASRTPDRIASTNAIVYTSIYRAKGNEANLVILLNCNAVPLSSRNSNIRNKIFTAMTRAKVNVWLFGKDMEQFQKEIDAVKENDYMLKFIYPTDEQIKEIRILGDKEEKLEFNLDNADEFLQNIPLDVLESYLINKKGKNINE